MGLIIKICGLSTPEAIDAAIAAGADMVGLVFFPPSPRYLALDAAAVLAARARGRAEIVALSVDMDEPGLAAIVERVKPDWLQFHGKETPEQVAAVKRRFALPVMKAIGVRERADLAGAKPYRGVADRLLLDARPPRGATRPGGNAMTFDWGILDNFDPGMSWMLSGGITVDNVGEAVTATGASGIDVSSGVEVSPGRKDLSLIKAFIAAARAAERQRAEPVAS